MIDREHWNLSVGGQSYQIDFQTGSQPRTMIYKKYDIA